MKVGEKRKKGRIGQNRTTYDRERIHVDRGAGLEQWNIIVKLRGPTTSSIKKSTTDKDFKRWRMKSEDHDNSKSVMTAATVTLTAVAVTGSEDQSRSPAKRSSWKSKRRFTVDSSAVASHSLYPLYWQLPFSFHNQIFFSLSPLDQFLLFDPSPSVSSFHISPLSNLCSLFPTFWSSLLLLYSPSLRTARRSLMLLNSLPIPFSILRVFSTTPPFFPLIFVCTLNNSPYWPSQILFSGESFTFTSQIISWWPIIP